MGAVDYDSPEALFALMLTLPVQVIVGHTPPVIKEEGKLQLPFLAHPRHGASHHRKSAHFSRNGIDGRTAFFGVSSVGFPLMSFLSLNLTAAFCYRWYARCGQGSSNSLPQVVALHRRGAYPIRPVIRLE